MADMKRRSTNNTYGSLAYDLDYVARERLLEEAAELPKRPEHRPELETKKRSLPKTQVKAHPSPLLLASLCVLCVMVAVLLVGYSQLTAVSNHVSKIRSEINIASDEHVSLLTSYERTFDLSAIKQRAEKNGMCKPGAGQIEYLDLSGDDSAVVYRAGADGVLHGLRGYVTAGVSQLYEYFR